MSETLTIAQALIRKASVTPDDEGCQRLLSDALEPYGFSAELMQFGDVQNLWLRRGTTAPLFVFAGHTFVENRLEQGKAGLKTCYLGSVKTLDIEEIKIKFDREF